MEASKTILLTTLNARYSHASIGLRYLYANMQELKWETGILEFTINDHVQDMADSGIAESRYLEDQSATLRLV